MDYANTYVGVTVRPISKTQFGMISYTRPVLFHMLNSLSNRAQSHSRRNMVATQQQAQNAVLTLASIFGRTIGER